AEAPSAPVVAEAPAQPAAAPAPALAAEAPAVPAVEAPVAKAAAAPAPAEAAPAPASVVVPEQTGNASLALGHRGVVRVATYSPSGRLLVTGADDRTLHVVDVATGDRVWTLTDLPNTPTALAVSEEAFLIVAGGPDGTLHAWRNGKALGLVHELAGGARTLRFEPGTNHLVAIDQRRGLRRLDTETWERSGPVLRLGRGGPLFSSALSGDGKIVVVVNAGTGRRIVPRDTDKGRVAMELDALPNVLAVATDQTGRWIVTANEAGKLQLIDHGSDIIVKEVDHGGPITALALHPTRGILASGSSDGSVQIWDLAAGKVSHTVPVGERAITALAFAPGTSDLTVATAGLLLHTLDATTGQRRDVLFGLPTGTAPALAFDQGGKRLATAAGDGGVHFWDVATGRHTGWLQKTGEVRTLVFAGDTLVVGSADGRLSAWRGDKSVWQVDARDAFIALDASTSLVAAASSTLGQVRLFRLADGQELPAPLGRKRDRLGQVRFSDDGHTLAVGSSRGEVALYDVAGTEPRHIRELLRGKGTVLALGWRSDGAVLGASFSRGGLLVYDVGSRKRPPALQRSGMTALPALAVVGNRVVAGALDGSIRGWNHITSQPEASGGRMGELTRWAASSDGRLFAASGPDGAVRIGALEPGALASLSLFAVGQAWVGWTDKGHYDGNKTGIAWLRIEREGKRQAATEIPAMQSATALTQAMRNPGTQTP
ncbi:MAG: WD40 repeat protein, partial [Myxococcota bacterium]